jgi:hypothetical protein
MVPSSAAAFAAPHASVGVFMQHVPRCRAPSRVATAMQIAKPHGTPSPAPTGRRGFMAALLTAAIAGASFSAAPGGASAEVNEQASKVFELVPTKENKWVLGGFTKNGEEQLLDGLASCDVVFLGEHHNKVSFHMALVGR